MNLEFKLYILVKNQKDKSLNFENYIEGYQSNIFQKFFYWNNNDNCFIF